VGNQDKECAGCRGMFTPDPRIGDKQKNCGRKACRRARAQAKGWRWRAMHPDYDIHRRVKKRGWAAARGYWREYRRKHPDYRARDNERRRRAKVAAKRAANRTAIGEISRRKLANLVTLVEAERAANQTSIHRLGAEVVNYLVWRERAANQPATDPELVQTG
jgi:hypothetical protein